MAARARSKSLRVHSGLSSSGCEGASIFFVFISLDFSRVGLAEADHVQGVAAISNDRGMKPSTQQRHPPKPSLAVIFAVVLDRDCGLPVEVRDAIERQRALGDIADVLSWIERNPHSINCYSNKCKRSRRS